MHISPLLEGDVVLAASAYVVGAFGLAGSLIGGAIAGGVSYQVARQAREVAESTWMRDTRRDTYGRFLGGRSTLAHRAGLVNRTSDGYVFATRAAGRLIRTVGRNL